MHLPDVRPRVASVDLLRGMIMMIMALDHVREFWGTTPFRAEDVTQTSTLLFFTRWVTHFCAPTFAFLSGVSIFLVHQRTGSKKETSLFVVKRGLWLVILQVLLLSFLFQFSYNLIILEIIWVLGWSMVIMGALIWLPKWAIALFAILVIAGHNLLPFIQPVTTSNFLLAILHNAPAALSLPDGPLIIIAYTVFPWVGVVAFGYVLGGWLFFDVTVQKSRWRILGLSMIGLFILLRLINQYGDQTPWIPQERGAWFTFLSFLNVSKYPPSLDFLLLTLGVTCLFLALFSVYSPPGSHIMKVFGAVPFFFYIIHIPLILLGAYLWLYLQFGQAVNLGFQPPDQWPAGYELSLLRVYGVWICYLILLYFPCRWYSNYKRTHKGWWLSYL